jgi:ATP-dependent RNA helicase RhlE
LSFSQLSLHPSLLQGVKDLGFTRPTPIQEQAIPPALAGRDVLACAMTGSGKTAGFMLPILHHLLGQPRGTTRCLVITPTRELAAQIVADIGDLAAHTPVGAAAVFGGVGMGPQEHAFRSGVDVIVATPGRLLDHFRFPYARLAGIKYLVLDEADRMLDMGFLPDIRRVLKHIPSKRQTLFFSATMPNEIGRLASDMLHDPVRLNLQRQAAPATGITQAVYPVPQHLKSSLLVAILKRGDMNQALVFTRTKHRADKVARFLVQQGVRAERIHGNRSQSQRTFALEGFKSGKHRVLVATDIAARGIDVEALGHVVNYDVPGQPEDYIHRVGRTGRAEATGEAFTFVSREEEEDLRAIERVVGKPLPRVTVPDFDYGAAAPPKQAGERGGGGGGGHGGGGGGRRPHGGGGARGGHGGGGGRRGPGAGRGGHGGGGKPRRPSGGAPSGHASRSSARPSQPSGIWATGRRTRDR